jgi:inner membrane protein
VENLSHTLVGAAIGEAACPPGATAAERRLFAIAGSIAANLPDIDLIYTGVIEPPLGYLLHHRGHTHTLAGAAVQTVVLAGVLGLFRAVRTLSSAGRSRLRGVAGAGLLSHVLLDWTNSYGVHPFSPLDNRWYYGDTFFIVEPVLWLALGLPLAFNVRGWPRFALAAIALVLPVLATLAGLVPWSSLAGLAAAGLLFGWLLRRQTPVVRAVVALTVVVLMAVVMAGVSRIVRARVLAGLSVATMHDVILTPNPSSPSCWAVIVVSSDPRAGTFTLRRGSYSLLPSWRPPAQCALSRTMTDAADGVRVNAHLIWSDEITERLGTLRALQEQDCHAAAWLRFGRAPVLDSGRIFDLRFSNRLGANFSSMALGRASPGCPAFVPPWVPPRADVLGVVGPAVPPPR